jgi:hypothetical protein
VVCPKKEGTRVNQTQHTWTQKRKEESIRAMCDALQNPTNPTRPSLKSASLRNSGPYTSTSDPQRSCSQQIYKRFKKKNKKIKNTYAQAAGSMPPWHPMLPESHETGSWGARRTWVALLDWIAKRAERTSVDENAQQDPLFKTYHIW